MTRPIHATISLPALRHNYYVAKRLAPRSKVLAVVKANAYGHGLARAAKALDRADGFALIEIEGAVALRERFAGPIVLLEGCFAPSELELAASSGLSTVVHCEEQLAMLEGARLAKPVDAYLKVDTGMHRLGFAPETARAAFERLRKCDAVKSITLMTHFANADRPDGVEEPMRRFALATKNFTLPKSLANSAAIFAHPSTHGDIVRLGIGLYGATPFADRPAKSLGLKPVMTLASELIAVRELAAGEAVGYGGEFRAEAPMRIGVVAGGYADGYPRHAPTGTPIVVAGVRTRIVGRVSMDMIAVDLASVADARIGSPVVLWGEALPVDEVAVPAGTVGYELLCAVAARVPMSEIDT